MVCHQTASDTDGKTQLADTVHKEVSGEKLTSDEVDLRAQIIIRNKRGHCVMIKEIIHSKALTIKMCAPA